MAVPPREHPNLRLLKCNTAALRERLQHDMARTRENIRVREAALAADRNAIMTRGRAAVARVKAAEPLVYKTTVNNKACRTGDPALNEPLVDDNARLMAEAVGDALGGTRFEMRADARAMVEAEVSPLRERLATLEGQLKTLTTLLGTESRSAGPRLLLKP